MDPITSAARTAELARWLRPVAAADALLLVVLVVSAVSDADGLTRVLGPLHGVVYLVLVGVALAGAIGRVVGWWVPVLVAGSGGPPGAIVAASVLRRRVAA